MTQDFSDFDDTDPGVPVDVQAQMLAMLHRQHAWRFGEVIDPDWCEIPTMATTELDFLALYAAERVIRGSARVAPPKQTALVERLIDRYVLLAKPIEKPRKPSVFSLVGRLWERRNHEEERNLRDEYVKARADYELFLDSAYRRETLSALGDIEVLVFGFMQRLRTKSGLSPLSVSDYSANVQLGALAERVKHFSARVAKEL